MRARSVFVAVAGLLVCAGASRGQVYDVQGNAAASSASWGFSLSAPFQTSPSGTSYLIGNYDPVNNPTGTRTIPGLFGGDTNANTPVPITGGSVSSNASSGSTPLHPDGSFLIALDIPGGACAVSGLVADILNGQTASASVSLSITYNSFRTRQPTCTILGGFPISIPLGTVVLQSLVVTQDPGSAPGTLTSAGGGAYDFSVPITGVAGVTATLNGESFPVDPVPVAFVLTGTVTPSGNTASLTSTISVNQGDSQPGQALDPIPFDEPLCGGHLIANIVLASINTTTVVNASLVGSGTRVNACDPDVNCDGSADGFDVEVMEQAVAGDLANFCRADPDFNRDGSVDGFDVEALESVVGGGQCP
jgi:hypothetical protein